MIQNNSLGTPTVSSFIHFSISLFTRTNFAAVIICKPYGKINSQNKVSMSNILYRGLGNHKDDALLPAPPQLHVYKAWITKMMSFFRLLSNFFYTIITISTLKTDIYLEILKNRTGHFFPSFRQRTAGLLLSAQAPEERALWLFNLNNA